MIKLIIRRAVFVGYVLDAARRPAPPGLPTLWEYRCVQGDALPTWLRFRLDVRASG